MMSFRELSKKLNRFVRVAGREEAAAQLFGRRLAQNELPVVNRANGSLPATDYLLIDPGLAVTAPEPDEAVASPDPRLGYAGYSAQQRFWLLEWLNEPTLAAPPAFQHFYLAHLEARLFESAYTNDALLALRHLQTAPGWDENESLNRVILLGCWLNQDGDGLAQWLAQGHVDERTLGVALGMAALLEQPLSPELLTQIWASWRPQATVPPAQMLAQHLLSLTTTLGQDPLAHALAQLPKEACHPKTWRGLHRDLRIALPQPDLRPVLEPLLAEMALAGSGVEPIAEPSAPSADDGMTEVVSAQSKRAKSKKARASKAESTADDRQWLLVLEFGHSRSEYFDYVLHRAREMADFTQIMDEDRQIVYRVQFRKRDLRPFWRLWDYVQNWSNTHVYIHGKELEKWKIWPYSQYMR